MCEGERKREILCVCEREKERESVCVCVMSKRDIDGRIVSKVMFFQVLKFLQKKQSSIYFETKSDCFCVWSIH